MKKLSLSLHRLSIHSKAVLNSYSELLFLGKPWPGVLLIAMMTWFNPNLSLSGLLAVLITYQFARFLKMKQAFLHSGFYTYNALLVGLSIGAVFKISPLSVLFIISLSIFTFMVNSLLYNVFSTFFKLPVLSLPFVIVSSIAYLASSKYSSLFVLSYYPPPTSGLELYFPFWLAGYLKSLGAILFYPHILIGLGFSIIIFLYSRILFMLTLVGYFTGTLISGTMQGSFIQAFSDTTHFNYILIAMAIGGVFMIPSPRSYLLCVIAVASATSLLDSVQVFWATYGLPAFTLPFNMITLIFIYVLEGIKHPMIAHLPQISPEATLDHYLAHTRRFKGSTRSLALPFTGEWVVWQGVDGAWTHKGNWKHAYDFVIFDSDEKTYRNGGHKLEDYYAFRKPVLSPVRGRVLKVVSTLFDNAVGELDEVNNWGNLIIIYDVREFYVEISHFAKDSIKVKEGQWVERGMLLGMCGNSGYSAQPHIHIQVQALEQIGSYTLPFSFVNYLHNREYQANAIPEENDTIAPLFIDKKLDIKTTFLADQNISYEVFKNGTKTGKLELTVKISTDGTFYLDSGKGQLYFGKHEGTFIVYSIQGNDPCLKAIFLALPRLPMGYKNKLCWNDSLTSELVLNKVQHAISLFVGSFFHELNKVHSLHTFSKPNTIEGVITSKFWNIQKNTTLELDDVSGFKRIQVDSLLLTKI